MEFYQISMRNRYDMNLRVLAYTMLRPKLFMFPLASFEILATDKLATALLFMKVVLHFYCVGW